MHAWTREYLTQFEWISYDQGIEDLLAIADETAVNLSSSENGITNGKFKLLLNGKPDFPSLNTVVNNEKAAGVSDSVEEEIQHVIGRSADFDLDVDGNAYIGSYFFSAFLQSGFNEASLVDSRMTAIARPYETYQIDRYHAFIGTIPKLNNSRDQSILVRAALPYKIKLSAKEGQILRITASVKGAYWTNSYNLNNITSYPSTAKSPQIPYLKWQHAKVWLDDAYVSSSDSASGIKTNSIIDSTNKLPLDELNVLFDNGVITKFYNSETIIDFTLGKIRTEGDMRIPWVMPAYLADEEQKYYWKQINDFRNGIVKRIRVQWGTTWNNDATSTDNTFILEGYIKYVDGKVDGEDHLFTPMNFVFVRPDMTTSSFTLKFGYDYTGSNAVRREGDILTTQADEIITTESDELLLTN